MHQRTVRRSVGETICRPVFLHRWESKRLKNRPFIRKHQSHFINSPVSHFKYFSFLGIDDDYGHYPRGRVIYNNRTNEFYLYIDKDYKKNKKVIENVMKLFNLCSYNTIVKTDEHYIHYNL